MKAAGLLRGGALVVFVAGLSSAGCTRPRDDSGTPTRSSTCPPCPCDDGAGRTLSAALISRLASARAFHHQADLLLRAGDTEQAITKISAVLALDLSSRWPEAEEVRVDATARLAKLLLKLGRLERATALVDRELKQKPRASFYLANLYSVKGELLEASVKKLEANGQKVLARQRAKEAIAAFEVTIRINKRLQAELLRARPERDQTGAAPKGGTAQ